MTQLYSEICSKLTKKGTITMSFDIYLVPSFRTYNNLTTLSTIFGYLLLFIFLEVAVHRCSIKKQLRKLDIRTAFVYRTSLYDCSSFRSTHQEVSCKKSVLKIFPKVTGKQLCQSLLFKKVAVLRPTTLLKRDPGTDVFWWILGNFKNTFLEVVTQKESSIKTISDKRYQTLIKNSSLL